MTKHHLQSDFPLRGKLKLIARQMRLEPTEAEDVLWQRLRDRQLAGYRFRRQYTVDRFIVDFICTNAALIVEVDGTIHSQQVEADKERDQILTGLGFHILRFTNTEVLEDTNQVLSHIQATLAGTDYCRTTPSLFSHASRETGEGYVLSIG